MALPDMPIRDPERDDPSQERQYDSEPHGYGWWGEPAEPKPAPGAQSRAGQ
jgi:hypothetical protein